MKKLITIILSVLLIASLFVSCDNTTKAVQDELAEVTLSTQADSRSLTVSNPLEDLRDVSWTYKARKVSETQFNYGEKTSETNIDLYPASGEKQKLTLSQGKWIFELFGRNSSETLLYHGTTDEVLILRSNGLNQITVEVSPYTDALGQISFNGVKLVKANGDQFTPNYLNVTGPEDYHHSNSSFNGTDEIPNLKAGQYTVTVAWKDTINEDNPYTEAVEPSYDVVIASETIVVTVYGGRTTEISGNISEETGSGTINGNIEIKTKATQQKTVVANTPTIFTVNVAPANSLNSNTVENTTVTFAKDDFNSGIRTELEVSVKDLTEALDSGFTVSDGKTAAGITLTLSVISEEGTKTPITVSGKNIVIETHIVKGLSGVQVKYNGTDEAQPDEITTTTSSASSSYTTNYYESDTGKLVFSTTHFSEYYVVADEVVALNTNTNTAYATLADAINQANEGETVSLLKDVTLTADLQLGSGQRGVSLNLNGKKINGGTHQVFTAGSGITTIFGDGTIENYNTDNSSNSAALYIPTGSKVIIDGATIEGYYGVYVNGNLTIKKATINAVDCGIAANYSAQVNVGSATEHDITVTASNGNCISTQAAAGENGMRVNVYGGTFTSVGTNWKICPVYWASHGTLNVYGGTFSNHTAGTEAAAIYQKNGTINIHDGEFSSRAGVKLGAEESNSTSINLNIYGGKIEGTKHAALYYKTTSAGSNCTEYNISISGGVFIGDSSKGAIYSSTFSGVITPTVHVTGGTFSSELSEELMDDGVRLEESGDMWTVVDATARVSSENEFKSALKDTSKKKIVVENDLTFTSTNSITRDVIVDIGSHKLRTEDKTTGIGTNSVFSISNGHLILKGNKDGLVKSGTAINPWANRSNPTISMYNPGCLTIEGITVEGPDAENTTDNKASYEAGEAIEASSESGISEKGSITIKNAKIKGGIVPENVQNSSSSYALSAGEMFIVDIDNSEFSTGYIHGGSGNSYNTTIYFSGNTNVTMRNSTVTAPILYYPQYGEDYRSTSAIYHAGGSDKNNYGTITFINCNLYGKNNKSYTAGALTLNGFCNIYCENTTIQAEGNTDSTYDISLGASGKIVNFYVKGTDNISSLRKYTSGSSCINVSTWTK